MTKQKNIPFFRLLKRTPFLLRLTSALYCRKSARLNCSTLGLDFSSPVGVAAGIDRNGEFSDVAAAFSPSFIEIGPIRDVKYAIKHLKKRKSSIKVFANLSNHDDLQRNFSLIYDFVDGIVLNVSKNTSVSKVIDYLLEQRRYNDAYKPIIFKLFSDLDQATADEIARYALGSGIDAVMSGEDSFKLIKELSQGLLPIIVSAGISTPEQAAGFLDNGADLIAVTNSAIQFGPRRINKILKYLDKR